MREKGLLRVIDANFNRCKEGLRVTEDIFRFVIEDDRIREKIRVIRHALDTIAREKIIKKAIASRNATHDSGRHVDALELNRKNSSDILYANLQRAKESLRVIEEFFKIMLPSRVGSIKKIRYQMYTLEKEIYVKVRR
ncbi:MAG: thiamine-phosphate pyrophosphorylase [Candidatus Omnitrophica bacterium]|nr:thiamine-phosphate pyrophosphorylase [Candidatus Omnitrophota bacterium]